MSKMIQMTEAQLKALLAQAGVTAKAEPAKPQRALSFISYASGERAPSTAAAFALAVQTGKDAEHLYAHASSARRAVSALSLREILAQPALRAILSALK